VAVLITLITSVVVLTGWGVVEYLFVLPSSSKGSLSLLLPLSQPLRCLLLVLLLVLYLLL
jgi:hypothetical protein